MRFIDFLHALHYLLGAALCLFAFARFGRGQSLRPHEPGHRPPSFSRHFWRWRD